jgi:hypothetical protein
MSRGRKELVNRKQELGKGYGWTKWVMAGVIVLILGGMGGKEWRTNQVVGHADYRFNMALIGDEVTFVSFDPVEKSVLSLKFPNDLAIRSRTSGEYTISSLYKLGSYKGQGGRFVRQKIQGFMRVPIPGYLVGKSLKGSLFSVVLGTTDTSLSKFDGVLLLYRSATYGHRAVDEDELVRAGVIADNTYHPERLQEYVGSRLFDWGVGAKAATVAIVNASGENGLGSDMADFLSNLGLDVVIVRSVNTTDVLETSEWQVDNEEDGQELSYIFQNLFEFPDPRVEKIGEEYRAKVLIKVGKDAKELF